MDYQGPHKLEIIPMDNHPEVYLINQMRRHSIIVNTLRIIMDK